MHLSAGMARKQNRFCFVVAAPHWVDTRWHLFRNPCSYTWKALALFFWNREINKCPYDCFRIKKKKNNNCVCVHVRTCLCGCIIRTICCTLSPHSHLFIWRESTNIIWIPIRLTLRVHTLHHHEACTVHCNLNPLFESCVCVCVRETRGRWQWGRLKLTVVSGLRGNVQSGVKIVGL